MKLVDILIIIVIGGLFILAAIKLYRDSKLTKAGLGCSGCRIADTCQKAENLNRKNIKL